MTFDERLAAVKPHERQFRFRLSVPIITRNILLQEADAPQQRLPPAGTVPSISGISFLRRIYSAGRGLKALPLRLNRTGILLRFTMEPLSAISGLYPLTS